MMNDELCYRSDLYTTHSPSFMQLSPFLGNEKLLVKITHHLSFITHHSMKVLICESEDILLAAIEFRLKKLGLEVLYSKKKGTILDSVQLSKPELVILDADMGKQAGMEIIQQIQNQSPESKILLLVDPDEEELTIKALNLGIDDFLSKPFKPSELILRVKKVLGTL